MKTCQSCHNPCALNATLCGQCWEAVMCYTPSVEEIYRTARDLREGRIVPLGARKAAIRPRGGITFQSDDDEREWRRSQVTEEVDDE